MPISRDLLAALAWPDEDPDVGRSKLRRHLYSLRKSLPPTPDECPYILNTHNTTAWNLAAPASIDVVEFEVAARDETRIPQAADLYAGDFLFGYDDEWVVTERERLRTMQLDNLRKLVYRKRSSRDFAGALADVARTLAIDPWREDAIRMEMLVRGELGDRSGALATYRRFEMRLRDELDTAPIAETRAVYETLRQDEQRFASVTPIRRPSASRPAPQRMPFHGRDEALAELTAAWDAAVAGAGQLVMVAGEAGIGKSRLVAELMLQAEAQGARTIVGVTSPNEAQPYEAVGEALRAALPLLSAFLKDGRVAAVLGKIVPIARSVEAAAPTLGESAERARLFDTTLLAFSAIAGPRPALFVLEDLHWARPASLALVEHLVRGLRGSRAMVVVTYRDDEIDRAHPLRAMRRRLAREDFARHLALGRLDVGAIERIVREAGGDSQNAALLARRLLEHSEGVPLFIEEALRDPSAGGTQLNLTRRFAALRSDERGLAEMAAVVGSGFNVEMLRELSGWGEGELIAALDGLVAARFVREPLHRRYDYGFTHHLLQEAIYAGIDERERRRRHEIVARVLLELYPERVDDLSSDIGRHFVRAGRPLDAARSFARAADRALALYAVEEAFDLAGQACSLTDDPAVEVRMRLLRARLAWQLARVAAEDAELGVLAGMDLDAGQRGQYLLAEAKREYVRGDWDAGESAALGATETFESTGDTSELLDALIMHAELRIMRGKPDAALPLLERARMLALELGRPEGVNRVLKSVNAVALRRGDYEGTFAQAEELLTRARDSGDLDLEAECENRLGMSAMFLGRPEEATLHVRRALAIYDRIGSRRNHGKMLVNLGTIEVGRGHYQIACATFEAAAAALEEGLDRASLAVTKTNHAFALVSLSNYSAALTIATDASRLLEGHGGQEMAAIRSVMGQAERGMGDLAAARASFQAAVDIHVTLGTSSELAEDLASLLDIDVRRGDLRGAAHAEARLREIDATLGTSGAHRQWVQLARARLAQARGERAEAAELLREARALFFQAIEALPPSGRESFAETPANRLLLAECAQAGIESAFPYAASGM